MSKNEVPDSKMKEHFYDDIRELDNPLPNWWVATFVITVIFGLGYYGYYEWGGGPGLRDELSIELAEIRKIQKSAGGPGNTNIESSLLAALSDPSQLEVGKKVFTEKCAACHGIKGEGVIGPNLTDDYWIHGAGKLPAIAQVVSEGIADKGMPPWGSILKPEELIGVSAFVKKLRGTLSAEIKGKMAQGDLVNDR